MTQCLLNKENKIKNERTNKLLIEKEKVKMLIVLTYELKATLKT